MNLASAIIEFRFYNNESVITAYGNQKGLFINGKTHNPIKMDSEQRSNFEKYLINEE